MAAQKLLSAVYRLQERFGLNYVVDFLRGSAGVRDVHKEIKTFGIGKDISKDQWKQYARELMQLGYLEQSGGEYPLLKLSDTSWSVLKGEVPVMLTAPVATPSGTPAQAGGARGGGDIPQPVLLAELKQLRRSLAEKERVPPYIIFSDATLAELCAWLPQSMSELTRISGFGEVKLAKYGEAFLEVMVQYCQRHGLQSQVHLKAGKAKPRKSNPKQVTASAPASSSSRMAWRWKRSPHREDWPFPPWKATWRNLSEKENWTSAK